MNFYARRVILFLKRYFTILSRRRFTTSIVPLWLVRLAKEIFQKRITAKWKWIRQEPIFVTNSLKNSQGCSAKIPPNKSESRLWKISLIHRDTLRFKFISTKIRVWKLAQNRSENLSSVCLSDYRWIWISWETQPKKNRNILNVTWRTEMAYDIVELMRNIYLNKQIFIWINV